MTLKPDTNIEITIHDVAYGGKGVGRLDDGMTVFVPATLKGERVKGRITKVHKRYAEAVKTEVVVASEHRREPFCPLADVCGGCTYQHTSPEHEWAIKQQQADTLLKRIGALQNPDIRETFLSPCDQGYRNKIVLHAGEDGVLGYVATDQHSIIDVPCCPLAVKPINDCLQQVREDKTWMKALQAGDTVTFRWTAQDGVVFWKNKATQGGGLTETALSGSLRVPQNGFYQVNPAVTRLLEEHVKALIQTLSPEFLIDLYCGAGMFALLAAHEGVPHVLGVEQNGSLIRAAKGNARERSLKHLLFAEGDAAEVYQQAIEQVDPSRTMVLVDPPRSGLSNAMVEQLNRRGPQHLVYISCAADTLARDVKRLVDTSYTFVDSSLFDMFPRTASFESVTLLERKSP